MRQTTKTHRPLLMTQNGSAAHIAMDVSDFEGTSSIWEKLRNQIEMRADVEAGIRELDTGKGIPHEQVFDELLKEFP